MTSHLYDFVRKRNPWDENLNYEIFMCMRSITGAGPAIHPTVGPLVNDAQIVDEIVKIHERYDCGKNLTMRGYWLESGFERVPIRITVETIDDDIYIRNRMNDVPSGEGRHGNLFPIDGTPFVEDGFEITLRLGVGEAKFFHADYIMEVIICDPAYYNIPEMFRGQPSAYAFENVPVVKLVCHSFRQDGDETTFTVQSLSHPHGRRIVKPREEEAFFAQPLWADPTDLAA